MKVAPITGAGAGAGDGDDGVADEQAADRRFRLGLAVIGAVGALSRLVIWFAKRNTQLLLNDSLYYSVQAADLARGDLYREPFSALAGQSYPGAEHPPLTSTLMAVASWFDDAVRWQRLVTTLAGIATVVLIGLLGRAIGGRRIGLIAAAVAVVYPNLWMNDGLVMSESISVLMVVVVLLATHRALEHSDSPSPGSAAPRVTGRVVWCGVAVGLATLARSELVLLIPMTAALLAGGLWRSDRRVALGRAAVVVAVAVATLAPWVGFNLARFERPVLLTTNDGTTLAGSYCRDVFSGPSLGGWSLLCLSDDPQDGLRKEPSERSEYRRGVALRYATSHAGELPKVIAARLGRTIDVYGLDNLVYQDVGEERWRWASWAGIASFWVLAPLAAFGISRVRRRDRWLLLGPVLVVLVTTVVFYGAHRIRSSAEPSIVIGAAVAIDALVRWRRRPEEAAA